MFAGSPRCGRGAALFGATLAVVAVSVDCSRARRTEEGARARAADAAAAPRAQPAPAPLLPRPALSEAQATRLAALSLACRTRAYPNKPSHVYEDDRDLRPPRALTPAFFGCYDWHSAVHGHWTMARLLRLFPRAAQAAALRRALDEHLTEEKLAAELRFFRAPRSRLFERPYGWAWLLRLTAELHGWRDTDAQRWLAALRPLARFLAARLAEYLERLSVPVRAGTHDNTAYALAHALDYARTVGDAALANQIAAQAARLFGGDRDCPTHYEPSGEDFISPCLAEADLMRRVLPAPRFVPWLRAFLPNPAAPRFAPLRAPAEVRDPQDPRIGHLIGLAFQRAAAADGIAAALPADDPWRSALAQLAAVHIERGLSQIFASGYGGEHWLASFAVYALTAAGHTPGP
jgi:hypothetical protein